MVFLLLFRPPETNLDTRWIREKSDLGWQSEQGLCEPWLIVLMRFVVVKFSTQYFKTVQWMCVRVLILD